MTETSDGLLLIASGRDPVLRWDGFAYQAEPAGLSAPTGDFTMSAVTLYDDSVARSADEWRRLYRQAIQNRNFSGMSGLPPTAVLARRSGFLTAEDYIAYLEKNLKLAEAREDVAGPKVISGTYYAYVRYIDKYGNPSSLSRIAGPLVMGRTGNITRVVAETGVAQGGTGVITVTSPFHRLTTGDSAFISGVGRISNMFAGSINYLFRVTVVDADSFVISGLNTSSQRWVAEYSGTASFTVQNHEILYENVPVPTDPKVVKRQILRNTAGQSRTFYVDVETEDLTTTTFRSTRSDTELSTELYQPVLTPEGRSLINEHDRPPNFKTSFVAQLGRVFAAVDLNYAEGAVAVTHGSTTVTGVATEWSSVMTGRFLYVNGADKPYEIDSVDQDAQTLTLELPYLGATDPFAYYGIKPPPAEARIVHYSGAGRPESWNPLDAFSLQDDGDELSGLMRLRSFLYILEKRHMYRFTFQSDPALDGYPFLGANRGCLNQNCFAVVEDRAYMLDEQGIHLFAGGESRSISEPIQDIFQRADSRYRINWAAARNFHCIHFPDQDLVKWFVCLCGQYLPKHALVYDYRAEAWSIEEYAVPIACSSRAYINQLPYVLLGSTGKRTLADGVRELDGPDANAGTVRGTVTSASICSLADTAATWPTAGLVGNPIAIAKGRGFGQVRVVVSVSGTTIKIDRPWSVVPDTTSAYQLGGIPWKYRTGKFWYYDGDDRENQRRAAVSFTPTIGTMAMRLYEDRSEEAKVWDRDVLMEDHDGVGSTKGSPDLTADLTKTAGYVQQTFGGHRQSMADGFRCVSLELEGVKSQEGVDIHSIVIDGVER